jgi:hypothetical protein
MIAASISETEATIAECKSDSVEPRRKHAYPKNDQVVI